MASHYAHLEPTILAFFKEQGLRVAVEPSGSRGPDIVGIGCELVGEIKHETELRSSFSAYWANWNSTKQKFGGKTYEYRLAEHVPAGVQKLSAAAKGWVAVICGQLYYMVRDAALTQGWIAYESPELFEASLIDAVTFLREHGVIGRAWLKSAKP